MTSIFDRNRTLEQRRQAVSNLFDFVVKGGVADTSRSPSEVIDAGRTRTLHRYTPPSGTTQSGNEHGIARDAPQLWAQAGLGPGDMAFVQAYDDYPVIVMLQLEALGFCAPGTAARFIAGRSLAADGELPLNTNGGMLSLGQAGAAGGFAGLTEAIRQLTGQALGAAVPDAQAGVVSCYGTVNYDRGLCSSAAVLTCGRAA